MKLSKDTSYLRVCVFHLFHHNIYLGFEKKIFFCWFWKKKCFFTPKKYFFWNVDFLIAPWKNVTVMRVGGITYQPGIMYFWLGYFINRYNSFIYLFYGVFSLHHLFWFPKFENQATLVPKGKLSRTNTWFFNSLWPIWLITNQILQITKT